jgi:hypothetical protein
MRLRVPLLRSPRRSRPGPRAYWSDPSRQAKPSHHSDCVKSAQRRFVSHRPGGLGAVPACKVEQPSISPQDAIMSELTQRDDCVQAPATHPDRTWATATRQPHNRLPGPPAPAVMGPASRSFQQSADPTPSGMTRQPLSWAWRLRRRWGGLLVMINTSVLRFLYFHTTRRVGRSNHSRQGAGCGLANRRPGSAGLGGR